jgi:hypothetical protein
VPTNALQHQTNADLAGGMNGIVITALSRSALVSSIAAVLSDQDGDAAAA